MMKNKIGIIGGSGLDDPKILINPQEIDLDTPYGKTSDKLICGSIGNTDVVILARHFQAAQHFADQSAVSGQHLGTERSRLPTNFRHHRLRFPTGRNGAGRFGFSRSVY